MKDSFMSFSCPELSLEEMLFLAKKIGYDAIEPRISAGHKHGIELDTTHSERKEIKQKVIDSGIPICCIATSCCLDNPLTTKQQIDETLRCIDLAADVGVNRIRVFGGNISDGISRKQATDTMIESLKHVANHANQQNVIICVETHDSWCNPNHLAEVIKQVNHSAIAVNWDIMHPVLTGGSTMDQAFQILKPWIKHVHFHDGLKNVISVAVGLAPIGDGIIDHRRAIELLKSISYDGYLSGEWINWEPYEIHLPRELATMKRYEKI